MSLQIGMKVTTRWMPRTVLRKAKTANARSLYKGATHLMTLVRHSIRRARRPSRPGQPPRTKKGQIKQSLRFNVDEFREEAIIGPRFSVMGIAGAELETGRQYRDVAIPKRPYMRPALLAVGPRMAGFWADSIK